MRERERGSDGEALLRMRFIPPYAYILSVCFFLRVRNSVADTKRKFVRFDNTQKRSRVIHAVGDGTLTVLPIVHEEWG